MPPPDPMFCPDGWHHQPDNQGFCWRCGRDTIPADAYKNFPWGVAPTPAINDAERMRERAKGLFAEWFAEHPEGPDL